jgi:hypothetical protein
MGMSDRRLPDWLFLSLVALGILAIIVSVMLLTDASG